MIKLKDINTIGEFLEYGSMMNFSEEALQFESDMIRLGIVHRGNYQRDLFSLNIFSEADEATAPTDKPVTDTAAPTQATTADTKAEDNKPGILSRIWSFICNLFKKAWQAIKSVWAFFFKKEKETEAIAKSELETLIEAMKGEGGNVETIRAAINSKQFASKHLATIRKSYPDFAVLDLSSKYEHVARMYFDSQTLDREQFLVISDMIGLLDFGTKWNGAPSFVNGIVPISKALSKAMKEIKILFDQYQAGTGINSSNAVNATTELEKAYIEYDDKIKGKQRIFDLTNLEEQQKQASEFSSDLVNFSNDLNIMIRQWNNQQSTVLLTLLKRIDTIVRKFFNDGMALASFLNSFVSARTDLVSELKAVTDTEPKKESYDFFDDTIDFRYDLMSTSI